MYTTTGATLTSHICNDPGVIFSAASRMLFKVLIHCSPSLQEVLSVKHWQPTSIHSLHTFQPLLWHSSTRSTYFSFPLIAFLYPVFSYCQSLWISFSLLFLSTNAHCEGEAVWSFWSALLLNVTSRISSTSSLILRHSFPLASGGFTV